MRLKTALIATACAAASSMALAQSQGVTTTRSSWARSRIYPGRWRVLASRCAWVTQLRVDELNEQGGIHGCKINLKVEDSGYDLKRAVLAAQKLVNQDKIYMVGHIGTAQNVATFLCCSTRT